MYYSSDSVLLQIRVLNCLLEVVNAQAKVTAKQEVIFKYLNPHIIAIATESEQGGKCETVPVG